MLLFLTLSNKTDHSFTFKKKKKFFFEKNNRNNIINDMVTGQPVVALFGVSFHFSNY